MLGCETRYLAEQDWDGWSVPTARGTVVHKAIELSINTKGEAWPPDLVDNAIASLEFGGASSLGEFLQELADVDRAELRSDCVDLVSKFAECWPPLDRKWTPVTESRVKLTLFDNRLVFQGKIDLTLGRARGLRAGKVLIDLKSGNKRPSHLDDLRFYALLETIRVGVPPRLAASYYLDEGVFHPEKVTEDVLFAAAGRATAGARRMIELAHDPSNASVVPGWACKWCRALDTCEPGKRSLREFDDPLDDFD